MKPVACCPTSYGLHHQCNAFSWKCSSVIVLLLCSITLGMFTFHGCILHELLMHRSRRGADRAAFKNRWNAVQERVHRICHTRKHSPKPSLDECVAILDEAASLPSPEQAPGGATVSSFDIPDCLFFSFNYVVCCGSCCHFALIASCCMWCLWTVLKGEISNALQYEFVWKVVPLFQNRNPCLMWC